MCANMVACLEPDLCRIRAVLFLDGLFYAYFSRSSFADRTIILVADYYVGLSSFSRTLHMFQPGFAVFSSDLKYLTQSSTSNTGSCSGPGQIFNSTQDSHREPWLKAIANRREKSSLSDVTIDVRFEYLNR